MCVRVFAKISNSMCVRVCLAEGRLGNYLRVLGVTNADQQRSSSCGAGHMRCGGRLRAVGGAGFDIHLMNFAVRGGGYVGLGGCLLATLYELR